MKVLLLTLTFVVIWRWLCANPLPCTDDKCLPDEETAPVHVCSNPDDLHSPQDPHRSQRSILATIPETASNVTSKPPLEKEPVATTDMTSSNSNKTKNYHKDKEVNLISVSNNQTYPDDGKNQSSLDKELSEQNNTAVSRINPIEAGTTTELKENLIKPNTSTSEDLNNQTNNTKLQENTSEVAENATALSDGTTKKENGNQADVTSPKSDKNHIVEEKNQTKKSTNHSMAINKTLEISQLNAENQTSLSNNSTRTKRKASGDSDDDIGDSRYLLVHDVPPCKRKRAADDKNITLNIQTLVHGLRLKREALNSSESESDTVETQNTTKISHHHHHSSKREANYDQEHISCCLRQTRSTNKEDTKNLTLVGKNSTNSTLRSSNIQQIKPKGGKNDTKEDEPDATTTPLSNIMKIKPRVLKSELEKTLNNTNNNDEPESARKVRSEDNISRKLLGIIDTDEVVDLSSAEEDDHLPGDMAKSDLKKSSIREFEPPFLEASKLQMRAIEQKSVSKHLKHVRCTCAMIFDEPHSKDKAPLISECLLDYTDRKAAIDKEIMCSKACSEMSQAYFRVRQVVLCTNVREFHHELQAIIPLDHSPEDDDDFEVIFCQVLPGGAEAPLQYIVSWLNIIMVDVVICLTGLGMVCMYLMCFVGRRRRGTIPIYSSASFTVK